MTTPVHKAYPCVVRPAPSDPDSTELLAFLHPHTAPQLPKGSIKPGESPLNAALRELAEETGLIEVRVLRALPPLDVDGRTRTGAPDDPRTEPQRWHLFLLTPTEPAPDRWMHTPTGGGPEAGLVFGCFWLPLDDAADTLLPYFQPVIDHIQGAIRADLA